MAILALLHRPLLWLAGAALVVDEPVAGATRVVIFEGNRSYDEACRLLQDQNGRGVVLVQVEPNRLERLGVVPSGAAIGLRELTQRGVPAGNVTVAEAEGERRTDWGRARAVRAWLLEHPDERIVVIVERLASRRKRMVLHAVLGVDAARVSVRALAHPNHDETNWWRRKEGLMDVVNGYLQLASAGWFGESPDFGDADPERLPEAER